MTKLNHLALAVSDYRISRQWYIDTLGLAPEFELPDRRVAAVQDDADITLIFFQRLWDAVTMREKSQG